MPGAPRLALLVAAAALALTGCGDDDESSGADSQDSGSASSQTTKTEPAGPPAKGVVATIEVDLTEFKLDPVNPGVQDAGKVAIEATNAGKFPHAIEVEGPKGDKETDEIAPGKTAKLTVDLSKPGKYKWYCPIGDHEQRGMTGSIFIAFDKVNQTDQPPEEEEKDDDSGNSGGSGGY